MRKKTLVDMVTSKIRSIITDALETEWEMLDGWGESRQERIDKLTAYARSEVFDDYPRLFLAVSKFADIDEMANECATRMVDDQDDYESDEVYCLQGGVLNV